MSICIIAEFRPLVRLFRENAELQFKFGEIGTIKGIENIAKAFREYPPTDSLMILRSVASDDEIVADYSWRSSPSITEGRIKIVMESGLIASLIIE
jgi:hypothetical protein